MPPLPELRDDDLPRLRFCESAVIAARVPLREIAESHEPDVRKWTPARLDAIDPSLNNALMRIDRALPGGSSTPQYLDQMPLLDAARRTLCGHLDTLRVGIYRLISRNPHRPDFPDAAELIKEADSIERLAKELIGEATSTSSPPVAGIVQQSIATTPNDDEELALARDALCFVISEALWLADKTDQLEAAYAHEEEPIDAGRFYAPSSRGTGLELEPGWKDQAPPETHYERRVAIDSVLKLRSQVDRAVQAVAKLGPYMDSLAESLDRRWTQRTSRELRVLRGAIVRGHGTDEYPSALPMIRVGVPQALRNAAKTMYDRMEDVKNAIVTGVKPHAAAPTIDAALLAQLKSVAAVMDPSAIDRVVELAAAKAVEAAGTRPPETGGTSTDWKGVQGRLLAKRELGECYTSLRLLRDELKCSDATIRKAIKKSPLLREWISLSSKPKAAPKATDLGAVERENAHQTTEAAPDQVLPQDEVDIIMAGLLERAPPAERAELNALNEDGRRALAEAYQAQNMDFARAHWKPTGPASGPAK